MTEQRLRKDDVEQALARLSELEDGFRMDLGYVPPWVATCKEALRRYAYGH